MAAPTPTTEPEKVVSGDSYTWEKTFTDYPTGDGWALSYTFQKSGNASLTVAASGSGTTYTMTLSTTNTALLGSGLWFWYAHLTKTGQRKTVGNGRFDVVPNPASGDSSVDPRSFAKKALDAIESAILSGIREDIEISVDGMVIRFRSFAEMMEARSKYKMLYNQELDAERLANGLGNRRKVVTRFVSAS